MKNKIILTILVVFSFISLIFTYNNDYIYNKEIMKITDITNISKSISTNNIGFKEEYYKRKISGIITNGKNKGKKISINKEDTYSSIDSERYFIGDKVFLENGDIYSLKRDFHIMLLVCIFILSIYLIGRKQGLFSFINVCFNSIIFYLGLNLYRNGFNLILLCFIEAIIFTIISLLFVTGKNKKTYCAIISTIISLIILFIILLLISFTGFKGINFNELSFLTVPPEEVFFASLLIGGLGAIMDVSITMSSSISEIIEKNPNISIKMLRNSGKNIGQDIMSTMINVLFFTYLSGELPILVLAIRNGYGLFNFISANFNLEIMRFLIGAICIVMTIPISNFISIKYFKRGEIND